MRVKAAVGFAADAAAFMTGGKEVEFLSFETWTSNTSGGGAHSIPMPAAGMLGAAGEVEAFFNMRLITNVSGSLPCEEEK